MLEESLSRKKMKFILLVCILLVLAVLYADKINLVNSDIGRHIKNGEFLLKNHSILHSNFYSYTAPNFYTINHHWAYGGIVYSIWKIFGFSGISLFNILLYLLTFLIIFKIAERKSNYKIAGFFAILMIPLMVYRKEVRPEVLSYFLFSIYYFILLKYKSREIDYKILLFILIPLQIFWVNVHIFFIFGIAMVSFFAIDSYLNEREKLKKYLGLLGALVLTSLVNPYFFNGLLEPFLIFREYGYLLAENMGLFFMQKRDFNFLYLYVELILFVGTISFFLRKNLRKDIIGVLVFLFFGTIAISKVRGITLLGFVLIPILSENFKVFYGKFSKEQKDILSGITVFLLIVAIVMSMSSVIGGEKGLGIEKGMQGSRDFFVENNLQGKIFNNYDIGGHLIFNLFPEERVFVDNRPEAYPVEFFKEIYIPMQEENSVWEKYQKEYGINVIYFYWHDFTPWGQDFLIKRLRDPLWVPVYVDDYAIIYLKNNEQNKELIEKFELSDEMFSVSTL